MEEKKGLQTPATENTDKPEEKKSRRDRRKWRYGTLSVLLTLAVIAGVVLLNLAVGMVEKRYPLNLDLTADDTFTLSEETLQIAAGLQQEVQVTVFREESYYASPSLGVEQLNTVARQFYDGMRQLQTASGGKITTRYFNFVDNPALAKDYEQYKVDEDSILFVSQDGRHGIVTLLDDMFVYDQNALFYYGQLTNTESRVEQTLASQLLRVTGELPPMVMMTGHGENAAVTESIRSVLTNNAYDVTDCDLTHSDPIPEDAVTLVFPGPASDFSPEEVVLIRTWLQNGGEYGRNLVLFTGAAACPNLYELINEEYGIEVTRNAIWETSHYNQNQLNAYGDLVPGHLTGSLTEGQVLSGSTLQLILHKQNDETLSLYNTPLVTFGATAQLLDLEAPVTDELPLTQAESYPLVGAAYAHKQVPSPTTKETVESFVTVWGSVYFLNANVRNYAPDAKNEALFVSAVNEVAGTNQQVVPPARSMEDRQVLSYETPTARWVGIGLFTVLLPLIVLTVGIVVFVRRRRL